MPENKKKQGIGCFFVAVLQLRSPEHYDLWALALGSNCYLIKRVRTQLTSDNLPVETDNYRGEAVDYEN